MNQEPAENPESTDYSTDSSGYKSNSPIIRYYRWMTDKWLILKVPWTALIIVGTFTLQIGNTLILIALGLAVRHHRELWRAWLNFVEAQNQPGYDTGYQSYEGYDFGGGQSGDDFGLTFDWEE